MSAHVGARLRHFRTAARITQEALARAADLTAKFVSQIENGHVNPSISVLGRLVEDGLKIPLSVFFAGDATREVAEDLTQLVQLMAGRSVATRRRILKVVQAICDE